MPPEWKTIISLCRFGALRCPSEVLGLRWEDINWEKMTMVIRCKKTKKHQSGYRVCPLFTDLQPHLRGAFENADEGSLFVIEKVYHIVYQMPEKTGLDCFRPKVTLGQ